MPYAKSSLPKCPVCGVTLSRKSSVTCRKHTIRKDRPKKQNNKRMRGICSVCKTAIASRKAKMCLPCKLEHFKPKLNSKEYRRNWSIIKKYGIDLDEFNAWWIVFRGRCGICNKEMKLPEQRQGQGLDVVAIDHCHKTGKIRGLLCNGCNKGLGLFKDNVLFLANAIKWVS